MKSSSMNIENTSFTNDKGKTWAGLGLGGTYNWADDNYSIYGEGNINTSLNKFAKNYSIQATVGFRVKW